MQDFRQNQRYNSRAIGASERRSLLLWGAFFAALSTAALAGIFGANPVLIMFFLLVVMAVALSDFRAGITIAIILLPLTATQYIPRELFGLKGLNPLNIALSMSTIILFLTQTFQTRKFAIPAWPRHFSIYIGAVVFAGIYGASHFSSIPAYYLVQFDSVGGYIRDFLLKPMIILATAFLLSVAVANARHPSKYLIPFFFSAIVLPIAVILYIAISGVSLSTLASSHSREFLSVIGLHANELGLMFNMAFALALFCFCSIRKNFGRWLFGATIFILTTAVMLTFSRGAYAGFLAVVGYLLFVQRRFRLMLGILFLIVMAAFLMPQAVVERATTGVAAGKVDDISSGRVDGIWRPLLPEIFTSPIIGHGLNSIFWSKAALHHKIIPVGHPHSAYLGLLLDFGVLGAIIIFAFFRHMWQVFTHIATVHPDPIWRGFFRGGTACILLLLVQGVTDGHFTPTLSQAFLWLSYGMAIGLLGKQNGNMKNMKFDTGRKHP